ncbi:indolepyruvate oxidoreductase subunit beta family protein [Luteithermobacter gelatinilyticus]|uniref:indolepyruvate oxidoreductase subunit beta family protein n=1 Tax=Luteithermobacter gelatinilyticus TaxID=2582913 RepID=UPI001105AF3A|nr:indolepyruvate oxidoreductase subunit beta family protein [Luteithermobacter gelatinilyticus]
MTEQNTSHPEGSNRPITIAISALGGQGGGVLTNWLVAVAEANGYFAQSTSVPGVAQRTGATIYYLEMAPRKADQTVDKAPVMTLMPFAGDVDIVVASELVEAGRAIQRQFVTPDKTTLIVSTHRVYSIFEKMDMGNGIVDKQVLLKAAREASRDLVAFDMDRLAQDKGAVISAVLFGAIAGCGRLPFSRESFEDAIRAEGKMVETNLRAFAAGFEAAAERRVDTEESSQEPIAGDGPQIAGAATTPEAQKILDRINALPQGVRETAYEGAKKLLDYQDLDYVADYLDKLENIVARDQDADYRLSRDVARHLALWMAFDDVIRVADLKIRRERVEEYRREVRAADGQIVYMVEFMKPRLEEILGTMPAGLARFIGNSKLLSGLIRRFTGDKFMNTGKVSVYLLMYFLASLRRIRRSTLRYQQEHEMITYWLELIEKTLPEDYELAVEITRCQRLIKGYGDTHERGASNFKTLMSLYDSLRKTDQAAARLADLRAAAMADEKGVELARALKAFAA